MRNRSWLLAAVAASVPLGTAIAQQTQAPTTDQVNALLKRLDDQEQRIKVLEQKLQQQSATSIPAPTPGPGPVDSAGNGAVTPAPQPDFSQPPPPPSNLTSGTKVNASPAGYSISSADGANVVRLRGNVAFDGRWYSDGTTPDSQDTWLFRKVRPYLEGTLDNIYDFRLMPDFAGGKSILVDAYAAARYAEWFVVQAGKFKAPVGLERLQPDQYDRFIELGLPSSLVPNRDLGIQVGGDVLQGAIGYAFGLFDGVTDGTSTDSNPTPDTSTTGKKDWEGRVFFQPFVGADSPYLRGLGFGVSGTYVNFIGSPTSTFLPSYKTPGQQSLFGYRAATSAAPGSATYADGQRSRWSPQAYYYAGSFGLLAEYVESSQGVARQVSSKELRTGRVDNSSWQVQAAYFLTGEREAYNSLTPLSRFQPGSGGFGAWELVTRYQQLHIGADAFAGGLASFADPAAVASVARDLGVGLNWYLNQNLRWMFDFDRTQFVGGASSGNRPDEKALLLQIQMTF
ncbi:MAG TPA: porin [Steroidobacteraceae bacterium]|jgi:phosphate-selective porin OprO/OprP